MGIYLGCLVTIRMTVLQKTIRFGYGQLLSANSRHVLSKLMAAFQFLIQIATQSNTRDRRLI